MLLNSTNGHNQQLDTNNSNNNDSSSSISQTNLIKSPLVLSNQITTVNMNDKNSNTSTSKQNNCVTVGFLNERIDINNNIDNSNTSNSNNNNNNNNINQSNTTQAINQMQQQKISQNMINSQQHPQQQITTYTALINNSNFLNHSNPNIHPNILNHPTLNSQQLHGQQQTSLIAGLNAANLANFVNFSNPSNTIVSSDLQNVFHHPQTALGTSTIQSATSQLNGIFNGFGQNLTSEISQNQSNLSDEQQMYEYMHQLLEEKEKLKELFNDPYNILLPISARLLEEG